MVLSLRYEIIIKKTQNSGRGLKRYQDQNASNDIRLNIQNQNLTNTF